MNERILKVKRLLEASAGRRVVQLDSQASRTFSLGLRSYTPGGLNVVVADRYGCFGDEALALGAQAAAKGVSRAVTCVVPGSVEPWKRLGLERVQSDETFLGFAGLRWSRAGALALVANGDVAVLGNDIMDGAYGLREISARVSILNHSVSAGAKAKLVNLSVRETGFRPALRILKELHSKVEVWARDSRSQKRLTEILHRDIFISPDVGFYLPKAATEHVQQELLKVATTRKNGGPVVAVVVNNHIGAVQTVSPEGLYSALCQSLSDLGCSVFVLAHDIRENVGDVELARRVTSLSEGVAGVIIPKDAASAKRIMQDFDCVVSGRMHAAIGSLSSGVPCVGLDYVDKFAGQFAWYGLEELIVPHQTLALNPLAAVPVVERVLNKREEVIRDLSVATRNSFVRPPGWLYN